jgi:hypothetical protein
MPKRPRRLAFKPSPLPVSATTRVLCIVVVFLVLGTPVRAQFWAQSPRFSLRLFREPKENEAEATASLSFAFFNESSGPWASLTHFDHRPDSIDGIRNDVAS